MIRATLTAATATITTACCFLIDLRNRCRLSNYLLQMAIEPHSNPGLKGYHRLRRSCTLRSSSVPTSQKAFSPGESWRAPCTMLAALLAGIVISLAHHFMNSHLHGRAVDDVSLSQSWIARFGTALAFSVKTSFTISVGVAFVQHQWLEFHRQCFRIDEVDALTSVLGNAFIFFTSTVWLRQPVMTMLGLVSWYSLTAALSKSFR